MTIIPVSEMHHFQLNLPVYELNALLDAHEDAMREIEDKNLSYDAVDWQRRLEPIRDLFRRGEKNWLNIMVLST